MRNDSLGLLSVGVDLLDGLLDLIGSEIAYRLDGSTLHRDEEAHRDALHTEDIGQTSFLVDIDLVDVDLTRILLSDSFELGAELTAGTAPVGVEVDDSGTAALEDELRGLFLIIQMYLRR